MKVGIIERNESNITNLNADNINIFDIGRNLGHGNHIAIRIWFNYCYDDVRDSSDDDVIGHLRYS